MANPEHLEILRQGVNIWNDWRYENGTIKIDLSKADLSDANLWDADLKRANLREANLRGANLHRATLTDADIRNANLNEANLGEARLTRANLSEAFLSRANLSKADFSEANLNDADISYAILTEADFSEAGLTGALLHDANLHEANFGGSDLTGAHLNDASLTDADLSGARLIKADIRGADFRGANFRGTDLANAICSHTVFVDIDLSNARGLETIKHRGPSTIGIDMLYKMGTTLPEVFLRGCGVPEILITFLPSMFGKAIDFYSCFISYSHADKSFARRVFDTLQGRGIRCWLDEKQVNPGEPIEEAIAHGIRYWDKVLLCSSEHSLKSWWVDNELDNLFEKERKLQQERGEPYWLLIPLDIDGYLHKPEYESGKKAQIRKRFAPEFKGWDGKGGNAIFEEQIERVIKALRTDGGKEPPPVSKLRRRCRAG